MTTSSLSRRILTSQRTVSDPMSPAAAASGARLNDPSLQRSATRKRYSDSEGCRGKENNKPKFNGCDGPMNSEIDESVMSSSDSLELSSSSGSDASSPYCESVKEYSSEQRYDGERSVFSPVSLDGAKRLCYNNAYDDGSCEEEEEEETTMDNDEIHFEYDADNSNCNDQDDAYSSDCSGSTVVATGFPPPPENATKEEMTRYYWEVCYGDDAKEMMECQQENINRIGSRSAPAKSCLSTKKTKSKIGSATSMTPRRLHPSPPGTIELNNETKLSTPSEDDSPPNTSGLHIASSKTKSHSAVKFGTNSAAEFDKLQPITEMTPMPFHVVQEIFPSENKEETVEEHQISRETARSKSIALFVSCMVNAQHLLTIALCHCTSCKNLLALMGSSCTDIAILATWDDLFDDDEDLEQSRTPQRKRGRKRTPYKSKNRRPSKNRRDSRLFSKERTSLLEENSDGDEDDSHSGLPFNVTIDPDKYTSPSSVAPSDMTASDDASMSIVNRNSVESTSSACVSPSSAKSETASSLLGRETPNSARTASSKILREVHASGAELPSNSPLVSGGLRPNQLNYSPHSSARSDSSPSDFDNQSLGSDIMSLFTNHTIDDESDAYVFERQLSILSNHPLQMLCLRIGDMIMMMNALQKEPLKFLNEDILRNLTPSTALRLVNDGEDEHSLSPGDSQWFQSILNRDIGHVIRNTEFFESLLLNGIIDMASHRSSVLPFERKITNRTPCDTLQTVGSCVKTCHDTATVEWSDVELAIAERSLSVFQESAAEMNASSENEVTHISSTAKSSIRDETDKIKVLEKELAVEVDRLEQLMRAQYIICSSLELERFSPIVGLSEAVRKHISPTLEPFEPFNGSDFDFSLLDGSAEVTITIDVMSDEVEAIGFSIKDGGASIKLLQAIFMGSIDSGVSETIGPFPIRNSVSSLILRAQSASEIFMDASGLLFRIDLLLKSVRSLETEFLCHIDSEPNGNVSLSFSAHQYGDIIKVHFTFESLLTDEWNVTTVPNDVNVSIISAEHDWDHLSTILEEKAKGSLYSASPIDHTILEKIVNRVMHGFSQENVKCLEDSVI
ncbi:hypothetical protein HJC23_005277 [Cyclotella cryptica]|uniref:Uncharacterized protein n=1 Tax=Cyclotella cryptica TaxID=29204 RepID=A0ABD3P2U2_9STRA|eukprot:CCRYP_017728-RA/>CCRYP_017728-RA protein AED:0.01 eAED:0.01 QI:89/1/1/1/1/1/3/2725/1075